MLLTIRLRYDFLRVWLSRRGAFQHDIDTLCVYDAFAQTQEFAMNGVKNDKKKERPKLVARPQRDLDAKVALEEINTRYSKTLKYLAR
jgi:hypothetical protein